MKQRRLAILLVMLALAACTQGVTAKAPSPYTPYPPETDRHTHGGVDM